MGDKNQTQQRDTTDADKGNRPGNDAGRPGNDQNQGRQGSTSGSPNTGQQNQNQKSTGQQAAGQDANRRDRDENDRSRMNNESDTQAASRPGSSSSGKASPKSAGLQDDESCGCDETSVMPGNEKDASNPDKQGQTKRQDRV